MSPEEIILNFHGKLVGTKSMQHQVAHAISKLPLEMVDYIVAFTKKL
jgi:hypothetical protein